MIETTKKNDECANRAVLLIAGTAWLFADEVMTQSLDFLFIDEAGQDPLANAVAVATAARNVVLLGDPLQLAQVSQGTHPEGAGDSVLEHLLGRDATVPRDREIFLEETWRMHPNVCRFVSDVVYESRLRSADVCAKLAVTVDGTQETGLRFIAIAHEGNTQSSDEEADRGVAEIQRLLRGTWTNNKDHTRPLQASDFLVVAAYNAQVRVVTHALERRRAPARHRVPFQPQPRRPRRLPRTRLGDHPRQPPKLLDVECKTPEQMLLENGLCRFVEMAINKQPISADG
jgi:superfamily I DNA and/or RNA helicase